MRRLAIILAIVAATGAAAQPVERIYVSSDRSVYIAGDNIWCSLFCIDAKTGLTSTFSAVSYVELISADGTAATAKISLMQGRGAGRFRIPGSTPTGNYRIVAYTAINANENGRDWMSGARTVSIFNTNSLKRVNGGVVTVEESLYTPSAAEDTPCESLKINVPRTVAAGKPFDIGISSSQKADVSVSVFLEDNIAGPAEQASTAGFLKQIKNAPAPVFTGSRIPEYEGEIIYGHQEEGAGEIAFLSSAGSPSDVYLGRVGENGEVAFFTNNIYGDRELVCEIGSIRDNFIYPHAGDLEPLVLCRSQYNALIRRKAALSQEIQADTLHAFLPRRQDCLLDGLDKNSYLLDEYQRFPSFREVLVEIVKELSIAKVNGQRRIVSYDGNRILTMLDGVVINDVSILEKMDAMLLDRVDVYTDRFLIGGEAFDGAVNFTTKKSYVKAVSFPPEIKVLDFKGVSYPLYYPGTAPAGERDYRQLLYWHPSLKTAPGQDRRLHLRAPSAEGRYIIKAEGFSEDGTPLSEIRSFVVRPS